MRISNDNLAKRVSHLLIVLSIGFQIRLFLVDTISPAILGGIWGLCYILLFCIYLITKVPLKKIKSIDFIVLFFLLLYFVRVFTNLFIDNIPSYLFGNKSTALVYLVTLVTFPYVFNRIVRFEFSPKLILISWFLFLLLLGNVFYDIMNQVQTVSGGRYGINENLNTIDYGNIALTFSLLSMSYLLITKSTLIRIVMVIALLFGLLSMSVANSRSPFVAFMLITLLLTFVNLRRKGKIIVSISIISLLVFLENIGLFLYERFNSTFYLRLLSLTKGMDSASGRDILYKDGLEMFVENLLWGKSFLLDRGFGAGYYVHNSFIESLMALGLLGGIFYMLMIIFCFNATFYLFKIKSLGIFFAMYFIQTFTTSMFSKSMTNFPEFWLSISLLLSIYYWEKEKKKKTHEISISDI